MKIEDQFTKQTFVSWKANLEETIVKSCHKIETAKKPICHRCRQDVDDFRKCLQNDVNQVHVGDHFFGKYDTVKVHSWMQHFHDHSLLNRQWAVNMHLLCKRESIGTDEHCIAAKCLIPVWLDWAIYFGQLFKAFGNN